MNASRDAREAWVVPDLSGLPSGGTLYDARLLRALAEAGLSCRALSIDEALTMPAMPDARYWVDSLYLEHIPRLRRQLGEAPLWLVLHYLPSLVASGAQWSRQSLTPAERTALGTVDGFLVTSRFMLDAMNDTLGSIKPSYLVEPGVDAAPRAHTALATPPRLLALGHVVPGKQLAELLDTLAQRVTGDEAWSLRVVGSIDADRPYAEVCMRRAAEHPVLRSCTSFSGALTPDTARAELCASDLLVSASRMESYGMALAEARAAGVPVLAHAGGHAAGHVDPAAGGELCSNIEALCERLLALGRDPAELQRRKLAASRHRRARSWREAATEFMRLRQTER